MKVLYVAFENEQYNPNRTGGIERTSFLPALKAMPGVEVSEYSFDPITKIGKKAWNEGLLLRVRTWKPDILFAFTYTDEIDVRTLATINATTKTTTIGFFSDDYWRFFNYSKNLAPYFHHVVTTYYKAVDWYRDAGFSNVILSQWAFNPEIYQRRDLPQDIDVSFIGQYKPARAKVIRMLAREGINVQAYGFGWPNGRLSPDEMLNVIARSKINLNLNVRAGLLSPFVMARIFLKKTRNWIVPDFHLIDNFKAYLHFPTLHTHARPFELAGAGGFVISGYSDGIERYYEEDKEMVFYRRSGELVEKIRHYLAHDAERAAIREAGYARTVRDHTYTKRLQEIFSIVLKKSS